MKLFDQLPVVTERLHRPIPDLLWHYTSFEGMLGIIKTKTLWASEVRHLNDSLEVEHGRELVKIEAERIANEPEDQLESNQLIAKLLRGDVNEGFFDPEKIDLYVTSFSTLSDQLSQWRGYTPKLQGVSLGFDLQHLRPALNSGAFQYLAPCIYRDEEKMKVIRACCESVRHVAASWHSNVETFVFEAMNNGLPCELEDMPFSLRQPLHDVGYSLGLGLLKLIALFKHSSFSEEGEWRFVGNPTTESVSSEGFLRVGASGFVPTLAPPISRADGTFPLREIVIGPCPNPALQERAIRKLLSWQGLPEVRVRRSETSFRAW